MVRAYAILVKTFNYLLYFLGKLLKSFPLSGTDVRLQSVLVRSSRFVLNLELGFEELVELKFEGV